MSTVESRIMEYVRRETEGSGIRVGHYPIEKEAIVGALKDFQEPEVTAAIENLIKRGTLTSRTLGRAMVSLR